MNLSKSGVPRSSNRPNKKAEQPRREGVAVAPSRGWQIGFLALALLLAGLIAYYPALHGGMLWDDDFHVTRPELRSWHGLYRIWFDLSATQQYYPIVHSAFWILYKVWGGDTLGYHLLNIVLHVISALLVALILRRLGVPWPWLAAVIFALHPVHVESVAWISELKNTLSGLFYLVAALTYLHFDKSRNRRFYAMALSLFVLALLSKTVTATLPAALLVAFWWQRGRLNWRRDALPLVPFFVVGAAGGLFTAWVERNILGAHGADYLLTSIERCLIAGRAVWFYLGKLFWPTDLIFIYPRWEVSQSAWWQYLYPLGLVCLIVVLWLLRKRSRAPLAAMLFFCGTLFPAMGFFNVYPFRYSFVADHFQYLATISIIALFCAGLESIVDHWGLQRKPAAMLGILVLGGVLAVPTWLQSHQYINAETLYRHTLSQNPSCWLAYNNLGNLLITQGRYREARESFEEALRIKPGLAVAYNGTGIAWVGEGELQSGIENYRRAIELDPAYAEAFNNMGAALARDHRYQEAIANYQKSLEIDTNYAMAHYNMANAFSRLNKPAEAEQHYLQAIRIRPDLIYAHYYLGLSLLSQGRNSEATEHLSAAFRLKPDFSLGYYEVGNRLLQQGRLEEAIASFAKALAIKPEYAEAHCNLGTALSRQGRLEEAIGHYREALRIRPDYTVAANNLGRALEQSGHAEEAIALYAKALVMDPNNATAKKNLEQALQSQRMKKHGGDQRH
jgi:tetratricopeptide (TPR) repeat protein